VGTSLASPASSDLRGAEEPRVHVHPPYERSRGQEAIALAQLAGLELDFWQCQALVTMCAVREDGKWACFEYLEAVARQNGKGSILEARALAGLLLFDERLILWSAHEYKTAMEGFLRVGVLLAKLGRRVGKNLILIDDGAGHTITIKVNNTNGEEAYERLDTGQRLKFIARSKGSGRGFSPDTMIVDEAMFYTPLQHEALLPALSARPNPQIIYMSSPPLDGDSGEHLFNLRDRAEAMAKAAKMAALSGAVKGGDGADLDSLGARLWGGHPDLEHGGDLDHLELLNIDDPALLKAANPALGIRITFETAMRERRSMTPKGYFRERLMIWPLPRMVAGGRINAEKWAEIQDSDAQVDLAAGVSLGVELDSELGAASIVLYGGLVGGDVERGEWDVQRQSAEEVLQIVLAMAKDLPPVAVEMARENAQQEAQAHAERRLGFARLLARRTGVDWVPGALAQFKAALNPIAIGMTAFTFGVLKAGLAAAGMVRPEDRKHDDADADPERTRPRRGDLLVTSGPDAAAACGQLIVAVDEKKLRVKPDPKTPEVLDEAAKQAKTKRSGDALVWVRADATSGTEISPVGALSSARYAHLSRVGVLVEEKPPPASPLLDDDGAGGSESGGGLNGVGF
jgi:hypothetical protein